jgi:hypothetical protein
MIYGKTESEKPKKAPKQFDAFKKSQAVSLFIIKLFQILHAFHVHCFS